VGNLPIFLKLKTNISNIKIAYKNNIKSSLLHVSAVDRHLQGATHEARLISNPMKAVFIYKSKAVSTVTGLG
jgi:hypothetical protein